MKNIKCSVCRDIFLSQTMFKNHSCIKGQNPYYIVRQIGVLK